MNIQIKRKKMDIPIIISREEASKAIFCFLGEFYDELISWIPYLYFIKKKLNIKITTLSRPGSKIFYYFSNNHIEFEQELFDDEWGEDNTYQKLSERFPNTLLIHPGYDLINQRLIQIDGYTWENKNIHTIISTKNHLLPDYSFVNKNLPVEIQKPFVVINNAFSLQLYQKYKAPINYFDREDLTLMKEKLYEMGYFIVYNHFVAQGESTQNFQLDDDYIFGLDQKSFDLKNVYNHLKSTGNLNEFQLTLYNQAEFVLGPQGNNLYLPALCRKNLWILMRDGNYFEYLEIGKIFDIEINIFYEPIHLINSLKNLQNNSERKKFTRKAIDKFHFSITGAGDKEALAAEELLFSVCIFAYNRTKYLEESINSVLEQNFDKFELIIYDGSPTENISELIHLINSDKIRYFREENNNAPDLQNKAIHRAKGKYLIWLASDDILNQEVLLYYQSILKENPKIDIIYGDLHICDEHLIVKEEIIYENWEERNKELISNMLFSESLPEFGSAIRKTLYFKYGNYNTNFAHSYTYEWHTRIAKFANYTKVDKFIYEKRQHSNEISAETVDSDFLYDIEIVKKIINSNKLEELFYYLNWENPTRAKADAYLYLSKRFLNLNEYNIALDFLKRIYLLYPSKNIKNSIEQFSQIVQKGETHNSYVDSIEKKVEKIMKNELTENKSPIEEEKPMSFEETNQVQIELDIYNGFSDNLSKGVLPLELPSPLLLNLGCGKDIRDAYINIDFFSDEQRVIEMDLRHLEFKDNSVDGILAIDILEHFSHREIDSVLKECARVLKPGAEIIIRCPSLRLQIKAYYDGDWDAEIASIMIFGEQTNPSEFHYVTFDERSIKKYLDFAGFDVISIEEIDIPQDKGFINFKMTVKARKKIADIVEKNNFSNGKYDGFFATTAQDDLEIDVEEKQTNEDTLF